MKRLALILWAFLLAPTFAQEAAPPQFKYWPRQSEELPIGDIVKLYEQGFAGCYADAGKRHDIQDDAAGAMAKAAFAGEGAGKLSLPFLDVFRLYPDCYPGGRQGRGDCVSWSTRNAILMSLACEAVRGKTAAPRVSPEAVANGVFSTEAIYWWRRHGGDGWSCDSASDVVTGTSGLWPRMNYNSLGVDLTRYSAATAGKYGSQEPPENYGEIGRRHLVKTAVQLHSAEEVRDFLAQGCGISTCGSEGFSKTRNEDGVSERTGSWAHAMAIIACDDRAQTVAKYGGPLFLIQNSWADWNHGPRRIMETEIDIPVGSFWARWKDISRREIIAFSGAQGWQIRQKTLGAKGVVLNTRRSPPRCETHYCSAA